MIMGMSELDFRCDTRQSGDEIDSGLNVRISLQSYRASDDHHLHCRPERQSRRGNLAFSMRRRGIRDRAAGFANERRSVDTEKLRVQPPHLRIGTGHADRRRIIPTRHQRFAGPASLT